MATSVPGNNPPCVALREAFRGRLEDGCRHFGDSRLLRHIGHNRVHVTPQMRDLVLPERGIAKQSGDQNEEGHTPITHQMRPRRTSVRISAG
jgi:hypothetical protein